MAASLTLTRSSQSRAVSARGVPGGTDDKAQSVGGSASTTISAGKTVRVRVSLAAAGTQTLDFTALPQLDDAGDTVETVNFATVYLIEVVNVSTNTAAVATVGNAGANGFFNTSGGVGAAAHTIAVPADKVPRTIAALSTGMTTSSRQNLLITAGAGGALVLDVLVVGTS